MGVVASSFEVRSERIPTVVGAIQRTLAEVESPAAVVVFVAGKLVPELGRLAQALAPHCKVPLVLASGSGVLSERRELEAETAATGMVWSGKVSLAISPVTSAPTAAELRALLGTDHSPPVPTLLLLRSEGFDPEQLWRVRAQVANPLLFGAGTHGAPGLIAVKDGRIHETSALALRLLGLCPPMIHTAHSCRLLAPPAAITHTRGSMVDEIAGEPALAMLERLGAALNEPKGERGRAQTRPLVFTVLAAPNNNPDAPELLVRGIQGVDPARKSLLISPEAEPGMLLTFAVRDSHAARTEMVRICRHAARGLAGGAPRFALYFNCSGRGKALHAGPNVDTRVLREQFPGVPIAGFQSAFEIGPFAGAPALQLYTGMLAVFAAPS